MTTQLPSKAIDILDHGMIRLVDKMGDDLSIVRAARTSYDAAWRSGDDTGSDERLIKYLWKHNHSTPFEAVEFQFEIKAPIFVFRQIHRHRTASINELSARYRELHEEYYLPEPVHIGVQSLNNKQGRDLSGDDDGLLLVQRADEVAELDEQNAKAFVLYRRLLDKGWPRELARTVLPLGTYSHMFWKMDLKNLFGFLSLRLDAHAQYEVRVYAEAMIKLIRPHVPVAVAAWESTQ
jgi:thymidylate synthase (FAD)